MLADRRTDMKPVVALRSFANSLKYDYVSENTCKIIHTYIAALVRGRVHVVFWTLSSKIDFFTLLCSTQW